MRKIITFALLGLIAVSAWLTYSKVMQARRESAYREAMAPFQHDLHLGMARTEVAKYLDSRRAGYSWQSSENGENALAYVVKIGEEPGGFLCKPWWVYIALEFDPSGKKRKMEPDPLDKLKDVHIKKIGTCL